MAATKRDLHLALGVAPPPGDPDMDQDLESSEPSAEADSEQEENDAIDLALDTKADPATRREAFRRAVSLCRQSY